MAYLPKPFDPRGLIWEASAWLANPPLAGYYKTCYNRVVWTFRPDQLRSARELAGLTQQCAASQLAVSQAYLAMIETGRRRVTDQLGSKMIDLYRLPATALPLDPGDLGTWNSASVAKAVANLGYAGFRHLRDGRGSNPAVVLLAAISCNDLEVRVVESLPWIAVEYYDLDWEWLTREAKLRDAQNRLGFTVALGRRVAEGSGAASARSELRKVEAVLERARLAREGTLCQQSLSEAERRWIRKERPADAQHWNLLTDLNAGGLPYVA
jgi:transcriptional regulator with XRE-family HTH domain